MNPSESTTFVPMLTVLAEYGNAPFLWLVDRPSQAGVGPNLCDGTFWDESFPMSEGLWRKFADWAHRMADSDSRPRGAGRFCETNSPILQSLKKTELACHVLQTDLDQCIVVAF